VRVLRVLRSLDPASGGPAEGVRQITPHLAALGVETTVATLDQPNSSWLIDQPFKAIALGPVSGKFGFRLNLASSIRFLAVQHDCVIIHDIWQYNAFATWRALRGSTIPYFVYTHGMLDPWFKKTYPLKHLKKWAYWPWGTYRVLRDAKAVLFTTEQEKLLARKSFWLYHARECVVGYGTSKPPGDSAYQRDAFLTRFPNLRDKRIILFLSRIHPKKGVDLLISGFAKVMHRDPSLRLVIAGPDCDGFQNLLLHQARALGVYDRIVWPGMLQGDLKWGAFRSAELFCLPSHQENFGIVVAEALACGLPVAVSFPVNISCEVSTANAGVVFSDTVQGVTSALTDWLDLTSDQKQNMSHQAIKLFNEKFDYSHVADSLIPILFPS
jgi:glycosyltransferase involved in cell wall biosynthesis